MPVAVNVTWPLGKLCATALLGEMVMDCRTRFEPMPPPHPLNAIQALKRTAGVQRSNLVMVRLPELKKDYASLQKGVNAPQHARENQNALVPGGPRLHLLRRTTAVML
jgi:hypothetical protein